jgi:hypothetical protein
MVALPSELLGEYVKSWHQQQATAILYGALIVNMIVSSKL